jgi:hypothetical protein
LAIFHVQREALEMANEEMALGCADFIRKTEQYQRDASRRVNIPQLNSNQMGRVRRRLSDLF